MSTDCLDIQFVASASNQLGVMILFTFFYFLVPFYKGKKFIVSWDIYYIASATVNIITLMICGGMFIKINAGSIDGCVAYPNWILPWWTFCLFTFIFSSILFIVLMYSIFMHYDNIQIVENLNNPYLDPKYKKILNMFSIICVCIMVLVFIGVLLCAVLSCDIGNC